jgi:hypothetical protein
MKEKLTNNTKTGKKPVLPIQPDGGITALIKEGTTKSSSIVKGDIGTGINSVMSQPSTGLGALMKEDLLSFSTLIKENTTPLIPQTPDQMFDKCKDIATNIDMGKTGNVEFDFTTKTQKWDGANYRLDNVWLMAKDLSTQQTESVNLKGSDNLNATVFIGGNDNKQAFIATQDSAGKGKISELGEFHAFVVDVSDENKESGTITSFNKNTGIVYTGIIAGRPNLDPIKSLLNPEPLPLIENKHD